MFNFKTSGRSLRPMVLNLLFVVAITLCLSTSSAALAVDDEMDESFALIGDYQPGVVLAYNHGKFKIARPGDVNPDSDNYVLIHGEYEKETDDSFLRIAKAIEKADSEANIFYVYWRDWARCNSENIKPRLPIPLDIR